MAKIEVRDARPGIIIMNGLIGNCDEMFEIRLDQGKIVYWVRNNEVARDIYHDALELARRDNFDPTDTSGKYAIRDPETDEGQEPD